MGGSDEINPLVELCRCTGGIKYTHYNCLKLWMQTKLSKKENEKKSVTSYNIKSFNCEICKTPFPFRLTTNGDSQIYDLIDIVRPTNTNYIILESLNQLKDNNNIKSIHVINLDDQKITLGRGHESDVRINDISVSRTHASIVFNSDTGKICIRDLKSKFGTLVLLKKSIQVREKKIHLQIGRTYLEIATMAGADKKKTRESKLKSNSSNSQHSAETANLMSNLNVNVNINGNIVNQLHFQGGANNSNFNNQAHLNINSYDFLREDNNGANFNQFFDLDNNESKK